MWHVEKGRRVIGGKSRKVSVFRTQGTEAIMASSVGFAGILDDTIESDFGKFLTKIEPPKSTKTKTSKSTSTSTTKKKTWKRKKGFSR